MNINNPNNISLEKLNLDLQLFCKSKIITSIFGNQIIVAKHKGLKQLIGQSNSNQIFIKTQIPTWWSFFSIIITISIFSILYFPFEKTFTQNFLLTIIILVAIWFFSVYSYLIIFNKRINRFTAKIKSIIIK